MVIARVLGVTQSTAWRLGHSIREMMHDRDGKGPQLKGIVEIDIKYLGGAPKPRKDRAANPRGKGTSKARILIAAERDGPVQGTVIQAETIDDIEAATAGRIESGSWIMSDSQSAFQKALSKLAGVHATVNHSQGEYVRDDVHSSSADGFGFIVERAKFGVWHKFGAQHVQRYVDEVEFRWSNRVRKKIASKKGKARKITLLVPVEKQITDLVRAGIGRRISRTKNYSFRPSHRPSHWPPDKPNTPLSPRPLKIECASCKLLFARLTLARGIGSKDLGIHQCRWLS